MIPGKDNTLLVEFDFLIDLDLAMYRFIAKNFLQSPLIRQDVMSLNDDNKIKYIMLARKHINHLKIMFKEDYNVDQAYYQIMESPIYYKLLENASAYDTFGLMVTFLREASSVSIDVLCKNEIEEKIIKGLNDNLPTVRFPNKKEINLKPYTALYLKYFINAIEYNELEGKHIYIPCAKYNMEDTEDIVDHRMLELFRHSNEIHLIDLYTNIKYKPKRKGRTDDEDIF